MTTNQNKPKFTNISDGTSDGIVFFYMKDKMLYPILINKEQAEMLDVVIAMPFKDYKLRVAPTPVEYDAIKNMIIE